MIAHVYAFIMCLSCFWLPASIYMVITHVRNYYQNRGDDQVDTWRHRTLAFRWLVVASVCASWLVGRAVL